MASGLPIEFDDWRLDQEVKVEIRVSVNDEPVFDTHYYSIDSMEEDLYKAENAIDDKLREIYHDEFETELEHEED